MPAVLGKGSERIGKLQDSLRKTLRGADWKNWLILLCFFCLQVFLLSRHEAWRDEAQAWTIGRNYSLVEIARDLYNEGHPILWFLVIKAAVLLGLPYKYFGCLSLFAVTAAAYILLRRSPFPLLLKCCILLSSLFTYYNPVIARSYSTSLLIVVILAVLYGCRDRHPVAFGFVTALLFQTHIHLEGLALGLMALTFFHILQKENRLKWLAAFSLECLSLLVLFLTLHQPDGAPVSQRVPENELLIRIAHLDLFRIKDSIRAVEKQLWELDWLSEHSLAVFQKSVFLVLLFIALAVLALQIRRKAWRSLLSALLVAAATIGEYLIIVTLIYRPHKQMATCALMLILFFVWIIYDEQADALEDRAVRLLLSVFILIVSVCTYPSLWDSARNDIREKYSGSKDTAAYINGNAAPGSVILMNYKGTARSVYAYVADERRDITWWEIDEWQPFRVHVWGKEFENPVTDIPKILPRIRQEFPEAAHIYYLTSYETDSEGMKLLYAMTEPTLQADENYWFYEVD